MKSNMPKVSLAGDTLLREEALPVVARLLLVTVTAHSRMTMGNYRPGRPRHEVVSTWS